MSSVTALMQQAKVCHVAHLHGILSEEKTVDKSFLVVYNKGRKKHIDCLLSAAIFYYS